jgi:hypothetical protein
MLVREAAMGVHAESHLGTVHQCPACPLRFVWKPELEHHLRAEHPAIHYDYVSAHEAVDAERSRTRG